MTTAEVADALQVHRKTVLRYVAARRLTPIQKLPGTTGAFLFRRQDVEALAGQTAGWVFGEDPAWLSQ